ncbi:hypothetical protein [Hazenella coriacea]|uniref:Uncharacterized protein n=1 Tax=Hazenella coriacea TaxID=1179467 RepID=A0A4V2UUQ4_9BACL|nr:hypothetical protein [Hazenella coriacea]TCS92417.1 hypothetical protein EDD58_11240 [Hazenella coriacea]
MYKRFLYLSLAIIIALVTTPLLLNFLDPLSSQIFLLAVIAVHLLMSRKWKP